MVMLYSTSGIGEEGERGREVIQNVGNGCLC